MFKKIDKLISKSFFGLFFLTFSVVLFILLLVFMSKYFEDLVGKDLGFDVLGELFFYFALTLIPQALPLSVLLASLMAFGNLGEHYELHALKSLGIPLTRLLMPIGVFIFFLSIGAFFFNNYMIPKINLKAYRLMYDIRNKKPTLDLIEGAFYNGIPGWSIRVGKKDPDGVHLHDMMIYDHTQNKGNISLIVAEQGTMQVVDNDEFLLMELQDGHRYSEQQSYSKNTRKPTEGFVREEFDSARFMFSLADFGMKETPEELFGNSRHMKNVEQLQHHADSLFQLADERRKSAIESAKGYYDYQFSTKKNNNKLSLEQYDSIPTSYTVSNQEMSANVIKNVFERASNKAKSIKTQFESYQGQVYKHKKNARKALYDMHRKFTLSVACFLMFLIGAPLGAIIKRGGLGLPVLISIVFFILYYVIDITGYKWSREAVVSVEIAVWTGNMVLLIIGSFFLRQARRDSRLFDTDVYFIMLDKLKQRFQKK